jgi:hypothetical protein
MNPIQALACSCGHGRVEGKIGDTKDKILASIGRTISNAALITCLRCGKSIEEWEMVDQTPERRLELLRHRAVLLKKHPEHFLTVKDRGQA